MKIHRTIPPAAAPISWMDLWHGLAGVFSGKRSIQEIETEMKAYFGVRHVFLVSSGKAALTLILLGLRSLSPKKEALIPAYTCFSVPSAIRKAGLKVALCDIDPSTLDFDFKLLEDAIGEDTLCVIHGHLFGVPSDVDRIRSLCRARGTFVVEDAAQAMGGVYKGKMLGTLGDVGFFSLGRGKNITCGSGGVIVTNSGRIADAIARHYSTLQEPGLADALKEFFGLMLMALFIQPSLYWIPAGLPFLKLGETRFYTDFPVKRLSGLKGGLLRNWQNHLAQANHTRAETGVYFGKRLRLKPMREGPLSYLRMPVLMDSREERDRIYRLSQKRGLGISLMYPTPVNEIEEIKGTFDGKRFPSAKETAERLLALPTHHFVSGKDRERICELFEQARYSGGRLEEPTGCSEHA